MNTAAMSEDIIKQRKLLEKDAEMAEKDKLKGISLSKIY